MKPSVVFIKVADNQSKLTRIVMLVQKLFEDGQAVVITTPNQEAAVFLDQLLWRMPEESFLPHAIHIESNLQNPSAQQKNEEQIVITVGYANPNQAGTILNLCSEAVPNPQEFEKIFELFDQTHPAKEELSKKRQLNYQQQALEITIV